jgi:methylmalonyl-CoA mutase
MSGLEEPEELQPAEGALRLAGDDDVYDAPAWETATAAVLRKGRKLGEEAPDSDVWQVLTRTTLDGIDVAPIGQPSDLEGLTTSGRPTRTGAWDVRTPLQVTDAKVANEEALADLETGATSLFLALGDEADLAAALQGVLLDLAPVTLDRPTPEQAEALATVLEAYDGPLAPGNNLSLDQVSLDERGLAIVRRAFQLGIRALVVDGTALHDQGASDGQELGWAIAVGIHHLRTLGEAGFSVDEAARLIEFRLAASDEQFPTIAKMRAARRLWARVLEASGGSGEMLLHAVTSRPMTTRRDPWVNMLRGTVAAFAAGVGGADSVTVVPFDERLGKPDAFGRRIARNTSALLIEESHVAAVTDPAGGSYAVEKLTDDLAVAAWAELGRIETDGGAAAEAARAGVDARVAEVAAARDAQVADRSRPITGLSEFPNLGEELPDRPEGLVRSVRQYGHAYEDMRAEPAGQPVFLATMGSIAAHTARATFVSNLFAAGGVAVEAAGPTDGVESLVAAYGGQRVVCLAGTDVAYAEWGAEAITALREAGASYVVLAGKPGDKTVTDVDDSAAMGVDALGFLARIREELGK